MGWSHFFKKVVVLNISYMAKWTRGWTANLEGDSANPRSAGF